MAATSSVTSTSQLIRYGGEFADAIIERADGSWLTTVDGRRILDFTSGQMCATLGHGHPAIIEAIRDASGRVVHLFSGFVSRDVTELARELMAVVPEPLARAMFLSTGGEANGAALRLAKLHTGGHEVLAFTGSWHGMTAGASASTYSAGRRGYGPATPGAMALPTPNPYRCPIAHCRDRCDLPCLDVGMALADAQSVGAPAAVIAEPILSVGGIVPLPDGYMARLRERCDERGMLLILDEAQTAMGRRGGGVWVGGRPSTVRDGHDRGNRTGRGRQGVSALHLARLRSASGRCRARGTADRDRRGSCSASDDARWPPTRRPRSACPAPSGDRRRSRPGPDARHRPCA